jgi:hypothetical protein
MHVRTAFLIALGAALTLPYITVVLLRGGGPLGIAAVTAIFLGAIALVVLSDFREDDGSQTEDA